MERYNMSPFGFPFLFKEFFKILRYKLIYGTQEIKQMNKGKTKERQTKKEALDYREHINGYQEGGGVEDGGGGGMVK